MNISIRNASKIRKEINEKHLQANLYNEHWELRTSAKYLNIRPTLHLY